MNQEPVLIKGVVAFPNPNGNREIRFIDAFYHDLFKIPDHSSIVINYLDGGKRCVPCEYIDDTRHPNFKKSAAGGAEPYVHKPQEAPDYALPDLPYEFHALDDYDFIEMEDSQNEQEE